MNKLQVVVISAVLSGWGMAAMATSCPSIDVANQALAAHEAAGNPANPINFEGWTVYAGNGPLNPGQPTQVTMFFEASWNNAAALPNTVECIYSNSDVSTSVIMTQILADSPVPNPNPNQYWVGSGSGAFCGPSSGVGSKATAPSQCAWNAAN